MSKKAADAIMSLANLGFETASTKHGMLSRHSVTLRGRSIAERMTTDELHFFALGVVTANREAKNFFCAET